MPSFTDEKIMKFLSLLYDHFIYKENIIIKTMIIIINNFKGFNIMDIFIWQFYYLLYLGK